MKLIRREDYWIGTHDGPLRPIVVEAHTMREAWRGIQTLVRDQIRQKMAQTGAGKLRRVS
jgi:hypothetical protein